jgi:hypothetical protein
MDSGLRRNDPVDETVIGDTTLRIHRISLGLDPRAIRRLCRVGKGPRVEPEGEPVIGEA